MLKTAVYVRIANNPKSKINKRDKIEGLDLFVSTIKINSVSNLKNSPIINPSSKTNVWINKGNENKTNNTELTAYFLCITRWQIRKKNSIAPEKNNDLISL